MSQIGIAVIGCGGIAEAHFNGLSQVDALELVAVMDVDPARARAAAETHGADRWYTALDEVLADEAVQACILCLPHHLHCDIALRALRANRHVLVEKPMALTLAEAQAMVDAAKEAGVQLMSGQVLRYRPAYRRAKEIIASGEIGRPVNVARRRLMYSKSAKPPWAYDPDKAGGWILYGYGAHEVDMALWLLDAEVEDVYALARKNEPVWNDYDEITLLMNLTNGAMATVQLTTNSHVRAWESLVIGTGGSLLLRNGEVVVGDRQETFPSDSGFVGELTDFANAIASGEPADASGEDVLKRCMLPLEAAKRSIERREAVLASDKALWRATG